MKCWVSVANVLLVFPCLPVWDNQFRMGRCEDYQELERGLNDTWCELTLVHSMQRQKSHTHCFIRKGNACPDHHRSIHCTLMEGEGNSEFRRKRTRTSTLLFCISIFFGQWGWFYSITAEHYLLYFDKMKPSPWDFFTHCSLGYFTAVLFHYLLIFQHAVCIAVIYTSSDSPQRFLTPQGEIMEFTWDTKGRQQVLQKRRQIDKLDSQGGNLSSWRHIIT